MSSVYVHKIGATLYLVGQLVLDGRVQDMTGWDARCAMRGPAGAITLECAWLDAAAGVLAIGAAPAEQDSWSPGRYSTDVRLESPEGVVLISSSAQLELQRPETT